jgi:hypothetical protein
MNSEKWLKLILFIAVLGLILKFISIDKKSNNRSNRSNHNNRTNTNNNRTSTNNNITSNNNRTRSNNNRNSDDSKCTFTKEDAVMSIKNDKKLASEKISQCNSKCSSGDGSSGGGSSGGGSSGGGGSGGDSATCKSCTDLLPVLDPMYNMREICKQLILLEDHLFQKEKRCHDCICKHFLTIEALAEEAITLDKHQKYTELNDIPTKVRKITKKYITNHKDTAQHAITAQELRELRKSMMQKSFNYF